MPNNKIIIRIVDKELWGTVRPTSVSSLLPLSMRLLSFLNAAWSSLSIWNSFVILRSSIFSCVTPGISWQTGDIYYVGQGKRLEINNNVVITVIIIVNSITIVIIAPASLSSSASSSLLILWQCRCWWL